MIRKRIMIGPVHILVFILSMIAILTISSFLLENFASLSIEPDEFGINYQAIKQWTVSGQDPYYYMQEIADKSTSFIDSTWGEPGGYGIFHHPLISALIIAPFTLLPSNQAHALWIAMSIFMMTIGLLLISIQVVPQSSQKTIILILLMGNLNYYSVHAYMQGSLTPFVIMIMAICLALLSNRKDQLAGFILTLASVNFQAGLIITSSFIIWAIYHQRKHFLRALMAGFVFELIISLILLPSWLVGWSRSILVDVGGISYYSSLLSATLNGQPTWLNLILHLTILLMVITIIVSSKEREGKGFLWGLWITTALGSIIIFPANISNLTYCLPAITMIFIAVNGRNAKRLEWGEIVMMFLLVLIPWVLIPFTHLTHARGFIIGVILAYPVISFIGLWWIRWWILRPEYITHAP